MAGYFHVSALREEASRVFTPSCMKNIWFVFSLVSYFGSCQQPQHPAKLAPNAPVFAQRIGAGSGKGGKTPKTNRPAEYKETADSSPKRNRMWGEGICSTGSLGVYVCGNLTQLTPRKGTQSVPKIPTRDDVGGRWGGGRPKDYEDTTSQVAHRIFIFFVCYHCHQQVWTCWASSNPSIPLSSTLWGFWNLGPSFTLKESLILISIIILLYWTSR